MEAEETRLSILLSQLVFFLVLTILEREKRNAVVINLYEICHIPLIWAFKKQYLEPIQVDECFFLIIQEEIIDYK